MDNQSPGMDGDKGGILINMTMHGENERVTQFEFLQLFTMRFGNFDPTGTLNAVKDIGLDTTIMPALESTPTRMRVFDPFTQGALSRDIEFVRYGARRFELKPQNQEDMRPNG